MMALLAGGRPRVAVHIIDVLQSMLRLPKAEIAAPCLFDKRLCSALLKNPSVMNPLVRFAFLNASETPASDLEFATIVAVPSLRNLLVTGAFVRAVSIVSSSALSPGRYVKT